MTPNSQPPPIGQGKNQLPAEPNGQSGQGEKDATAESGGRNSLDLHTRANLDRCRRMIAELELTMSKASPRDLKEHVVSMQRLCWWERALIKIAIGIEPDGRAPQPDKPAVSGRGRSQAAALRNENEKDTVF